ncbi:MAG: ROK family protein [Leptospiraceae bacterium]|nr:ROK family protein [Leptospiraceae bacterium]
MAETTGILGIDIGATSIKYGLVRGNQVFHRGSEPIASQSNAALLEQLAGIIARAEFSGATQVGIGSPGPLDLERGIIVASANMPQIKNFAVVAELSARFPQKAIRLENDANAATLGEFFYGKLRGMPNLAVFTLGTGVGGGCIFAGKLERGVNGNFFEIGHIPIAGFSACSAQPRRCGCGALGCLETYASATGISLSYQEATGEKLTAAEIARRAQSGDVAAVRAYTLAGEALGIAAAALTQIMNLLHFIFTGGVAAAENLLRAALEKSWREHTFTFFHDKAIFHFTHGDEDLGILGAAALFLENAQT